MAVNQVIFIRPGETEWNKLGRWQGWVSAPLNEYGIRQAQSLGRFIRNFGVKALYSSDLTRAEQTASYLTEYLGFGAILDQRLRERNIGLWQGLTIDEMRNWHQQEFQSLQTEPESFRMPLGESRVDVRTRISEAFQEYIAKDFDIIAVLSHTTAIKALLTEIIDGYDFAAADIGNTSVTTIRKSDDGVWTLVADNDLSHLEGLTSQAVPEIEENP